MQVLLYLKMIKLYFIKLATDFWRQASHLLDETSPFGQFYWVPPFWVSWRH